MSAWLNFRVIYFILQGGGGLEGHKNMIITHKLITMIHTDDRNLNSHILNESFGSQNEIIFKKILIPQVRSNRLFR